MQEINNYLIIAMHERHEHTMKEFLKKKGTYKIRISKEGFKIGVYPVEQDYNIIFFPVTENGDVNKYCSIINDEIIKKYKLNSTNSFALLHGNNSPFTDESIININLPTSNIKQFHGEEDFAYCLLKHLFENRMYQGKFDCNILPTWEKLQDYFQPDWLSLLVQPLLPIHLAIQTFFGISRKKDGHFISIGNRKEHNKRINDYLYKVNSLRKKTIERNNDKFPNLRAFLLSREAEYDFFVEIAGRFIETQSEESYPNEGQSFQSLLMKMFNTEKSLETMNFKDKSGNKIDLKQRLKELYQNAEMKALFIILSNIEDNKTMKFNKVQKNIIERSKKFRYVVDYKEWSNKPKHSKWPKDIDKEGSEPDESYWNLVDQLIDWNVDGKAAKIVIETIEEIFYYLNKVSEYLQKHRLAIGN